MSPGRLTLSVIFTVIILCSGRPCIAASHIPNQALHWNKGRGYAPFTHSSPEGILLQNSTAEPMIDSVSVYSLQSDNNFSRDASCHLSFRIDNRHAHPSRRYTYTDAKGNRHNRKDPPWAVLLSDADGRHCWITISKTEINDDIISSSSGTVVTLSIEKNNANGIEGISTSGENISKSEKSSVSETILAQQTFKDHTLPFAGETLWNIELSAGHLRIIAGATEPTEISDVPIELSPLSSFGFAVSPAGEILISDITYQPNSSHSAVFSPILLSSCQNDLNPVKDNAAITERIHQIIETSDDPIEGYWEIFDRTLDEALLKLGGEYKLAIVKNHDRYEIIYLSGARVNGSLWQPGMLKGILTPSSFPGLLNLEWFDSEGKNLSYSITAQTGYNGTLTLQFPYHSSVIRLRKVQ